ncbi:Bug family tripartite tricarboxylate transporter substrate binding protein [Ancylobacter oerskovii]|uniref:Bug family tripartite tricarboxylate transporter substrate binding protein n=1 Tax=Ancylobacter oerskovii TaxID=459519 RepID=A0ABW4YY47_9HYPH|nr:tripartite tricarboxylate transporter substrate binding protein [Ancylobacter oerskovii]MBS7541894.1 tripartite tricarboxylate transporter substrate binding protein [Ancylobacter oerskovii]
MKACPSVTRRAVLAGAALVAAGLAVAGPARAQSDYPNQPITLIVPFAPGGASDFAARLLQPRLSQILGQQIVVENRDGAAGNVGMDLAARAKPDGYTLFLGNVGTVSINPYIFSNLRVKPLQDFVPISIVADTPGLLIANPKFPPNNVKELVEYVKARPGQVNFASPGTGSVNRLEMEAFRREAGLDMIHVPYKGGAGPATADVMGGHVSLMFVTISSGINHVKGGRLKALGVSTKQRVPQLPDVPTMTEQGFPKSVSSSWQGVLAPAGTPQPIIDKLHAAVVEAMKDPTIRERMGESGVIAVSSPSPADFKAYIQADADKWSGIIKEIGAKAD